MSVTKFITPQSEPYYKEMILAGVLKAKIDILNKSIAIYEELAPFCTEAKSLLDDRYVDLYVLSQNLEVLESEDETDPVFGSDEEWNALSSEEQSSQWDTFHNLCAQGVADDMYFYGVMMSKHLVDYVGH